MDPSIIVSLEMGRGADSLYRGAIGCVRDAVNASAPGTIGIDFRGGAVRDNADLNRQFAALTALGLVGLHDDIGPMVASLLFDDSRCVTAQCIEV